MGNNRNIKLLLADVDGTLVTQDKTLTGQAVAAARELREAAKTRRAGQRRALAALLSRRHPPQCQQGRGGADAGQTG
jgi:hypothetical protein